MKYLMLTLSLIGVLSVWVYYWNYGVYPGEEISSLSLILLFFILFIVSLLNPNKSTYKCFMCKSTCTYEELYNNTVKGLGEVCNNCVMRNFKNNGYTNRK